MKTRVPPPAPDSPVPPATTASVPATSGATGMVPVKPAVVESATPTTALVPAVALAGSLRSLAGAFEHLSDFRGFFAALGKSLGAATLLPETKLQLVRESPADSEAVFSPGLLTIPLTGRNEMHGALQIARRDKERRFSAEDLQLVTALGSFIAALGDHALNHRDALRQLEEIRFLLDHAPVGFVVFDAESRPVLLNTVARRWLGETGGGDPMRLLATVTKDGSAARQYVRLGGKLISAETLVAPGRDPRRTTRVVVLTDLTADQTALLEALARELYRARWKQSSLCFALLEDIRGRSTLHAMLPDLRANLGIRDVCGPYDAHRVGIVLPDQPLGAALRRLRKLRALFAPEETAVALVAATPADVEGEGLLQRALGGMRPMNDWLRPAVLLHDDYPAVNDALALVLRREFDVRKSSSLVETRALLESQHFDAFVTELDLQEGVSGLQLAHEARALQPDLRTVFTATAGKARRAEDDTLLRSSAFFGKPFAIEEVAAHLRTTLATGAS